MTGFLVRQRRRHRRMHAQPMLLQIVLPRETLAANVAKMRFGAGVGRQVALHLRPLRESAPTNGAAEDVGPLDVGDEALGLG